MAFSADEVSYLRSQPLARLATRSPDGRPDVVPVAYEFDGEQFWIGGSGDAVLRTRKMQNVRAGAADVALVIDDMVSSDPFIARGIRVYGHADPPVPRDGMVGPGHYLRIVPVVSWSWNMEGAPVGEEWYRARRTEHVGAPGASG